MGKDTKNITPTSSNEVSSNDEVEKMLDVIEATMADTDRLYQKLPEGVSL